MVKIKKQEERKEEIKEAIKESSPTMFGEVVKPRFQGGQEKKPNTK